MTAYPCAFHSIPSDDLLHGNYLPHASTSNRVWNMTNMWEYIKFGITPPVSAIKTSMEPLNVARFYLSWDSTNTNNENHIDCLSLYAYV